MGFIGIICFLGICYLFSTSKKNIQLKVIIWGIVLQFIIAILILGIPKFDIRGPLRPIFSALAIGVNKILSFSKEGTKFLFGNFVDSEKYGFVIVLEVLPVIVFFSALMAVLYHWGIMQKLVKAIGIAMQKTMKVSGAESLAVAANIFIGQTEAPLIIRPYLPKMTRSELLCLMVGGLATVAGSVLVAYVGVLKDSISSIAEHLMTASVMSAPAALLIAKILIPETEKPQTMGISKVDMRSTSCNALDAITTGTKEGMTLAFNVGAMLLSFIAIVALINSILSGIGEVINFNSWGAFLIPENMKSQLSLQLIFAWICAPFAFLMGIPWSEALSSGALIGEKIVLNEFVAYIHLSELKQTLSERSLVILSYALCGFANFASIGILIGGISGLAPSRQKDIAQLGFRALLGGTMAAFITAAIAGILI